MHGISTLNSVSIDITEDSVEYLIKQLLQKKLNLLFVPALYNHPDLIYTTIRREEFYLAVPKHHVANSIIAQHGLPDYANLADLKDMPFISLYAHAYKHFINPLFQEAGYSPNIIFKCKNWDSSHSLVENGLGLSIVPFVIRTIFSEFHHLDLFGIVSLASVIGLIAIVKFVLIIFAAVKANQGEVYHYPLTIKFIK